MKKQNGLAKQFMGMIVLAALESVLLLTVSQVVLAKDCASGSAARRCSSMPPRNRCRSCRAM